MSREVMPMRKDLAGALRLACVAATLGLVAAGCAGGRRIDLIICGDVSLPLRTSALCLPPEEVEEPGEDDADVAIVSIDVTTDVGEVVYHSTADMCAFNLPFTVEIFEGYETVTIDVSAWGPAGTIRATARPSFPSSGVREIHVGLSHDCLNVRCPDGRTCVDGVCEPIGEGWGASVCR